MKLRFANSPRILDELCRVMSAWACVVALTLGVDGGVARARARRIALALGEDGRVAAVARNGRSVIGVVWSGGADQKSRCGCEDRSHGIFPPLFDDVLSSAKRRFTKAL